MMAFFWGMFTFIRFYIDILIDKLFGYYYDPSRLFIPKPKNKIVLESAISLAKKIRERKLKSEEVVEAFIDRIREINGILNAVVDDRFEEALKEAREIDKQIDNGTIQDLDFQEKPFLGVPFTAKETTSVKGLAFTMGIKQRIGRKATFDAEIVTSMKNAGAICIGVTNIPQLNYWQETSNPVYGITTNPYNTTRNVGGSSGGEASNLAACGTAISLGTDIGGSIRIPAFMCGVFGHKPTGSLTSTKGLTFRTGKEGDTMVTAGVLARHAEDLIPVLKVLIGINRDKLKLSQPVVLSDVRVFYVTDPRDPLVSPFRKEMNDCLWKTVSYFRDICKDVPQAIELKQFRYTAKLWRYWMTQEQMIFKNDLNDQKGELNAIPEIIKHFLFLSNDFTTGSIYNLIQNYLPKVDDKWAKQETENLKKALIEKLGDNGILLYPSAPFTASYHHTSLLRPFNFNLFSIFNVLKFPVTQVPLGLDVQGLPLGIQVVAAPYNDHLTIAVAKALESQFGGYVPPFKAT
ncbi:fatty-acid amide hydrolase 2 isoform X2 [Aethina tumida]|nr:fatty-acid amide hydrolase 2 isoform X2 [Aethina tumida]